MADNPTTPDAAVQTASDEPGGFLPSPLSPAPSRSTTSTAHALPTPSTKPLTAGATSKLIRQLDSLLLSVSRSHVTRYSPDLSAPPSILPLLASLTRVVELLWISSAPSLQTQYLLQIASSLNEYLPGYTLGTEDWRSVFVLLDKLDRCFHALVTAQVGGGLNMTEKVRLRSLVEATRPHVVKLLEAGRSEALGTSTECGSPLELRAEDRTEGPPTPDTATATETDSDSEDDMDMDEESLQDEDNLEWEIEVSRIYARYVASPPYRLEEVDECVDADSSVGDRTLQEIGDDLASTSS